MFTGDEDVSSCLYLNLTVGGFDEQNKPIESGQAFPFDDLPGKGSTICTCISV